MSRQRIAILMGTRPEAIKLAPLIGQLQDNQAVEPRVVTTGQHREMLEQVVGLSGLHIDEALHVMRANQTLAGLTARLMEAIDGALSRLNPDSVVVQGDTTTALVGAWAAFYRRLPIAHVEAGLRTGRLDAPFPEEANRVVVSRLAHWHFAPTEAARRNLASEGVPAERIHVTGNTVIDGVLLEAAAQARGEVEAEVDQALIPQLGPDWRDRPQVLITGHRRENHGPRFAQACHAMAKLAERFPDHLFVYPVHLNPQVQTPAKAILGEIDNVKLIAPQPYRPFVGLMRACRLIITDSGGVQEEAPALGKPVLVMRDSTERPEALAAGTVDLVGADEQRIVNRVSELLTDPNAYERMSKAVNPYGDGHAAQRIVQVLTGGLTSGPRPPRATRSTPRRAELRPAFTWL